MSTITLSQLPQPDVIEVLDFETILAERKAYFVSLYPADQQAAIAATLALESEPITKLLQENAYRELILRQRINDFGIFGQLFVFGCYNGDGFELWRVFIFFNGFKFVKTIRPELYTQNNR